MPRRVLFAALLLLSAAALAYFGFVSPAPDKNDAHTLEDSATSADASTDGSPERAPRTSSTTREAEPGTRVADAPAETYELRIQVVDRSSGAHVEGAEVRMCDDDEIRDWVSDSEDGENVFKAPPLPWGAQLVCRTRPARVTNEDGLVTLFARQSAVQVYVTARDAKGAREGMVEIDAEIFEEDEDGAPRVPTVRVELAPARDYRVRVRDAAGRVAPEFSCALVLLDRRADRALSQAPDPDEGDVDVEPLAYYTTDARGEFVVKQFAAQLEQIEREARENEDREDDEIPSALLVVPRIPLRELVYVRIPLDREPRELYELRLPPTASLELRYVLADGTPVASAMEAWLSHEDDAPRRGRLHVDIETQQHAQKPFGVEACARIPYVGLQVKLHHGYQLLPQSFDRDEVLPGFARGGALRHVTRLPRDIAAFEMTLRGEDGAQDLQSVRFDGTLDDGTHRGLLLRPDPDQRFRFYMTTRAARRQLDALFWDPQKRSVGVTLLQHPVYAGRLHVLPELRLARSTLRASGICRDDRGEPIARARVFVKRAKLRRGKRTFRLLPSLQGKTDAQGRFALPLPPTDARGLHLEASSDAHVGRMLPYRPGAEHEFRLQRRARLAVEIRDIPQRVPLILVRYASPPGSKPSHNTLVPRNTEGVVRTKILRIAPGRARVSFDAGGFYGSWTEQVGVAAGEEGELVTRAPRLHEYEFDFGSDARVYLRHLERSYAIHRTYSSLRFSERGVRVWSFEERLSLEFWRKGYAALRKRWTPGRHRVELRRAERIELRLEGLPPGALDGLLVVPTGWQTAALSRRGLRGTRERNYVEADAQGRVLLPLEQEDITYSVALVRAANKHGRRVRVLTIPAKGRKKRYTVRVDGVLAQRIRKLSGK